MDSVIYAPQEPHYKDGDGFWVPKGYDLSSLSEFGTLAVVWTPEPPLDSRQRMESEALAIAMRYREGKDYVLAIGSPTLIGILTWAIGWHDKQMRMLEWDRGMKKYLETLVT